MLISISIITKPQQTDSDSSDKSYFGMQNIYNYNITTSKSPDQVIKPKLNKEEKYTSWNHIQISNWIL